MYNESVAQSEVYPRFVEQLGNVYVFEVATSQAYVPVPVTECQAYDNLGQKYDLSPLVRNDSGWHVAASSASDKYIINVCSSISNVTTPSCRRKFFSVLFVIMHNEFCYGSAALVIKLMYY